MFIKSVDECSHESILKFQRFKSGFKTLESFEIKSQNLSLIKHDVTVVPVLFLQSMPVLEL